VRSDLHSVGLTIVIVSKYISNFRRQLPHLRVCRLICGFTARWFASFAAADRHLTEQRRNGLADVTIA
jgi:hypothetical protein